MICPCSCRIYRISYWNIIDQIRFFSLIYSCSSFFILFWMSAFESILRFQSTSDTWPLTSIGIGVSKPDVFNQICLKKHSEMLHEYPLKRVYLTWNVAEFVVKSFCSITSIIDSLKLLSLLKSIQTQNFLWNCVISFFV